MRLATSLLVVSVLVASATCASTGATRDGGSRDLITQDEVAGTPYDNAYDIVRSLRPTWLQARARGGPTLVYLDDLRFGGVQALQQVYRDQIDEIRFISASDATTRWGTDHTGGVIQVIRKR